MALRLSSLFQIGRALMTTAQRAMVPDGVDFDLGGAEMLIIALLLQDESLSIAALARRTRFAQSRVSSAVARLRERGIVRTNTDPADRRSTLAQLPPEVRRGIRGAIEQPANAALDELLGGLASRERTAVVRGLEILARRFGQVE
jgi:MarR family transcriptional regulator, 2-MHQ and catechol-resistance regulon repressor